MRAGPAAGHAGYFHELGIYGSDDELLQLVVPCIEEGVAAGEPTFVALHPREARIVADAVGTHQGLTFLPGVTSQDRPPAAIGPLTAGVRRLLERGAAQVRAITTVPHPGLGAAWEGWRHYEAAVNVLLADLPVWGLCLYDRRITPAQVIDDAARVHPHIISPGGAHLPNPRCEAPLAFLRSTPARPHPLEAHPPAVQLTSPTPFEARGAVAGTARRWSALDTATIEDLVAATNEIVTNASVHGKPPVQVRIWAAPDRVLVSVSDGGPGPTDPTIGLTPRPGAAHGDGGFGLWMAHQLVDTNFHWAPNGFTVRLLATARGTAAPRS